MKTEGRVVYRHGDHHVPSIQSISKDFRARDLGQTVVFRRKTTVGHRHSVEGGGSPAASRSTIDGQPIHGIRPQRQPLAL